MAIFNKEYIVGILDSIPCVSQFDGSPNGYSPNIKIGSKILWKRAFELSENRKVFDSFIIALRQTDYVRAAYFIGRLNAGTYDRYIYKYITESERMICEYAMDLSSSHMDMFYKFLANKGFLKFYKVLDEDNKSMCGGTYTWTLGEWTDYIHDTHMCHKGYHATIDPLGWIFGSDKSRIYECSLKNITAASGDKVVASSACLDKELTDSYWFIIFRYAVSHSLKDIYARVYAAYNIRPKDYNMVIGREYAKLPFINKEAALVVDRIVKDQKYMARKY